MGNPTQGGRSTSDTTDDERTTADAEKTAADQAAEAERAAALLAEQNAAKVAEQPTPPIVARAAEPEMAPEEIVASGGVVPAGHHDAEAIWVDEETYGAPPEGRKSLRETAEDEASAWAALDTTTKED